MNHNWISVRWMLLPSFEINLSLKSQSPLTVYELFLVQEHILYFITRLLSPPVPVDYSGSESHLIACAPMLNVLLVGISPVDCVQIFSIHGLVCYRDNILLFQYFGNNLGPCFEPHFNGFLAKILV